MTLTYIDFQIDVGRFLAAQRSYLRRLALCPPALPPVAGVQIVLDRVDIGPSSLRHDEPTTFDVFYVERGEVVGERDAAKGFRTVLAQQLTLQLTTDADIRSHPNADPPLVAWPVTALYELTAFSVDVDCCLRAAPHAVEFGPPPPLPVAIPPAVVAMLESYVSTQLRVLAPSGTVRMGLDALDLPSGFLNAGVTVSDTGTTLAIRVEIRASQSLYWGAWQNFHKGFIVDRREGRDWALHVPAAYLTHGITTQLWQNLPKDDDLEAYPGAAYVPLPGRARFDVNVLLIYHAVEVEELDLDITVSADPRVQLSVWVDQPNRLSAEIDFAGLVNPVGALSTLAVALVDALGIPARSFLYSLVGSAIVDAIGQPPMTAVSQPTQTTVRVDRDVQIPGIAGVAWATVTDLLAHPDGIALAGAFQVTEPSNAVVEVLGVQQFEKHAPKVSCGAASMALIALFGSDPGRFAILHAGFSLGNRGTAPLHLCGPPALERLDGPVQPGHIHTDLVGLPLDVSIGVGIPDPAYYAAPFPIDLMVRTNGGTRLIRFDPPPVVTQDDLDRLQAELLVKVGDCQQLVDPWFKYHRGYNPHWSPRPPEGLEIIHHWAVVVSGLPEDERVELRGPGGESLAYAVGGGDVAARVSVVVEPSAEGRDLEIMRVGELHEELADGVPRGLEVRQTDLIVLGELPLTQPSHGIGLVQLADGPAVVALLADRVEAFDVRAGASAGALASWQGRFHGILRSAGGSLLYGPDGVARLDTLGRLTATVIDEPVVDGANGPDGAYFVTAERILGLSSAMTAVVRSDRADVTSVGGIGSNMLLGHAVGVDVADAALGIRVAGARRSLPPVAALSRASALRRGGLLATWEDGSAGLLEERNGEPVEAVHYESPPMLAGAVKIGNRLVVGTDGSDRLRVLGLGRSVVL